MSPKKKLRRLAEDIKPEEVIDLTVEDEDPYGTCPICLGNLQNTVFTACGHLFCSECLEYSLKIRNTCPTCAAAVTEFTRLYI